MTEKYLVFHEELPIAEITGDNIKIKLLEMEGLSYLKVNR